MIPSIGGCGRPLCCGSFLSNFHPVSIKMAKDQSLSLSPSKISGICGRLLCCLQYEQETYEELNKISPKVGDLVKTPTGVVGEVQYINLLRQQVKVVIKQGEDVEIVQYTVAELERLPKNHKAADKQVKPEKAGPSAAKEADKPEHDKAKSFKRQPNKKG